MSQSIFDRERRICPVCGKMELEEFDFCECGWQNDLIQLRNPDFAGGANDMSLNQAREAYGEGKEIR